MFGETQPFDAATLTELYPTHHDYVEAVTESANAAAAAGFLVPVDAEALMAEVDAGTGPARVVPGPGR